MSWLIWIGGGFAFLALLLARKLARDAIRQDGKRVGSAMLAQYVAPDAAEARFVIVRGEPTFSADRPFRHQGHDFLIVSFDGYDDRSTVLRRWLGVTCRVIAPG
jgi:hypothetical protein